MTKLSASLIQQFIFVLLCPLLEAEGGWVQLSCLLDVAVWISNVTIFKHCSHIFSRREWKLGIDLVGYFIVCDYLSSHFADDGYILRESE